MKFKIDENLPSELAGDLVQLGHEADTVVGEGLAGEPDSVILDHFLHFRRLPSRRTRSVTVAPHFSIGGRQRRRDGHGARW